MCQLLMLVIGGSLLAAGFKAIFAEENQGDAAWKMAGIIFLAVGGVIVAVALIGIPLLMMSD